MGVRPKTLLSILMGQGGSSTGASALFLPVLGALSQLCKQGFAKCHPQGVTSLSYWIILSECTLISPGMGSL